MTDKNIRKVTRNANREHKNNPVGKYIATKTGLSIFSDMVFYRHIDESFEVLKMRIQLKSGQIHVKRKMLGSNVHTSTSNDTTIWSVKH